MILYHISDNHEVRTTESINVFATNYRNKR